MGVLGELLLLRAEVAEVYCGRVGGAGGCGVDTCGGGVGADGKARAGVVLPFACWYGPV